MTAKVVIEQIEKLSPTERERILAYLHGNDIKEKSENAKAQAPVAGLHPGAMEMTPEFDEPLPENFWLGKE